MMKMTQILINSKIDLKKRFNTFQFMELLDISYERLVYPIIEVSNYGTTWLTG